MRKQRLGRTGFDVSPVTYGGIIHMNESQEQANRHVAYAIGRGVNYFDVAPSYGDAQSLMGPALAPFRKSVYLACKTGKRTKAESRAELLQSLEALCTDHFDVYQIHALTTQEDLDTLFGADGAMETFLWAKKEGLTRNIGFSTHNESIAMKALELFDFDTVLFPMNWVLGIVTGWGDRISARVKETRAGLVVMKTLISRKWLPDEEKTYPKSWCKPVSGNEKLAVAAMKYGLYKGGATLIPPGNIEHFDFMLDHIDECLDRPLTAEDLDYLRTEAENVKGQMIFNV
jgi:aryl-alcohol dehydrogenase-like predicted oxidoreductase